MDRSFSVGILMLTALAATGCVRDSQIREELRAGQTHGPYVEGVPFEKQNPECCGPAALSSMLTYWGRPTTQDDISRASYPLKSNAVLGYDLWLYACRAGFISLEVTALESAAVDRLLEQGVPILLNLGSRLTDRQHYVLVVGHDRDRRLWVLHDGLELDRLVSEEWLSSHRAPTKGWGLVVFPSQHPVFGLGWRLHLLAAERAEDLQQMDAALYHLEEALLERGQDPVVWFRIGRLQKILGHPEEAEKAYRQGLRLDPEYPDAMNNLALLLAEDPKRLDEAEVIAQSSVTACGRGKEGARRLPYALDTLGLIVGRQKRPQSARNTFEAALLAIPPAFPAAMRADLERRINLHKENAFDPDPSLSRSPTL